MVQLDRSTDGSINPAGLSGVMCARTRNVLDNVNHDHSIERLQARNFSSIDT